MKRKHFLNWLREPAPIIEIPNELLPLDKLAYGEHVHGDVTVYVEQDRNERDISVKQRTNNFSTVNSLSYGDFREVKVWWQEMLDQNGKGIAFRSGVFGAFNYYRSNNRWHYIDPKTKKFKVHNLK